MQFPIDMQREEVLQLAEQSEQIVRKSVPVSVPVMVMAACASMAFYVTFMLEERAWLKTYMGMAMLQMVPLVMLKLKIWMCPDRLSLTPLLLVKTLLMHLFIVAVRCFTASGVRSFFDPCALVAGLAILHKSFGLKPADLVKHRDVGGLVALSLVLALGTAVVNGYGYAGDSWRSTKNLMDDAANYMDILAFVPVALLVCHESDVENFTPGTAIPTETKLRVLHFFAFIMCFYVVEDIIEPYIQYDTYKFMSNYELTVVAHVAHFVMLLDFVGYFLCQTWFPSNDKVASFEVKGEAAGLLEADEEDFA